jgi:hypothetical protein
MVNSKTTTTPKRWFKRAPLLERLQRKALSAMNELCVEHLALHLGRARLVLRVSSHLSLGSRRFLHINRRSRYYCGVTGNPGLWKTRFPARLVLPDALAIGKIRFAQYENVVDVGAKIGYTT